MSRSLAAVTEIVMGQSPPGETCNSAGIGLPLLNGPTEFGSHHPEPTQYTVDPRKTAAPGDLLFCVRGSTTGRMNWADQTYAIGRGIAAIRHRDSGVLQPLVRAVIEHDLPRLLQAATGSTFPNVSRDQLGAVAWPDLSQGDEAFAARVIGALDDKIEVNRRRAAYLVQLCRLVFDSRLDGAKAGQHVESLTLGDVVEVLETGGRPQGGVAGYSGGVPSIGAESITGLGEFDYSKTKYVPAEYYASMRRGKLENRDVLLYKDGGRPGLFEPHVTMVGEGFPFDIAAINEHVYRLRAAPPYTQNLLYLWLSGAEATDEMRVKGTGVAIPGLNSTALRSIQIPMLRPDAAQDLDSVLEPLVARVLLAARNSRVLAQLRDLLLPRLLGGHEMR